MEPEDDNELAAEITEVRDMLDSRYDDIVSDKVQLINGEEAFAHLRQRIEFRRTRT